MLYYIDICWHNWRCYSNVKYSPQESVVRGSAAQTADGKIRVRGPSFASSAIFLFVRIWGLSVSKISFLKPPVYYKLKNTTSLISTMCIQWMQMSTWCVKCLQQWKYTEQNVDYLMRTDIPSKTTLRSVSLNVCIINWKQIARKDRISKFGRIADYLETVVAYVFWLCLFLFHMFWFFTMIY